MRFPYDHIRKLGIFALFSFKKLHKFSGPGTDVYVINELFYVIMKHIHRRLLVYDIL